MASYSLSKSKSVLSQHYKRFCKKKNKISQESATLLQSALMGLQDAITLRDRQKANEMAKKLEEISKIHLKKSFLEQMMGSAFGFACALVFAIIIRQMAFENMEIPTGSMRPTFKENDRLIISKTQFGLNI